MDYSDEDWFLNLLMRIDLKITIAWARTYHHGSRMSFCKMGNFSLTISLLTIITSVNSLEITLAPLTLVDGDVLWIAKNP